MADTKEGDFDVPAAQMEKERREGQNNLLRYQAIAGKSLFIGDIT
jgi:hypothetical protein